MSKDRKPSGASGPPGESQAKREVRKRAGDAERVGLAALDNGDFDAAAESLLVAVAAYESLGELYQTNAAANYLGVALAGQGETSMAMRVWEEIIDRGWDSPTAYNCLIRHLRRASDRSRVQELYRQLAEIAETQTGDFFSPARRPGGEAAPPAPRILIADDEPSVPSLVRRLLSDLDYDVVVANNGKEALDAILESEFDVVLLDVFMPFRSGLDVLYRIRAEGIDTPVIVISGRGDDQMVRDAKALKAGYVCKPIDIDELVAMVEKAIDESGDWVDEGEDRYDGDEEGDEADGHEEDDNDLA